MGRALYEPGLGYYSAGLHKLGASGDFVTAPELGGLFAACLARQVAEVAAELDSFDVLEVGAGTGRLAADLLRELALGEPEGRGLPDRYLILETSADLRRVQRERIVESAPAWLDRVSWLRSSGSGRPAPQSSSCVSPSRTAASGGPAGRPPPTSTRRSAGWRQISAAHSRPAIAPRFTCSCQPGSHC
jgi:hypothetical protein